jgi:hypothetical protein
MMQWSRKNMLEPLPASREVGNVGGGEMIEQRSDRRSIYREI